MCFRDYRSEVNTVGTICIFTNADNEARDRKMSTLHVDMLLSGNVAGKAERRPGVPF